jgi:predicted Zn-dependent protease
MLACLSTPMPHADLTHVRPRPRRRGRSAVAALLAALLFAACATVPYTGRRQLALVSPPDQEIQALYDAMKRRTPVSRDPRGNEMVQAVGRRIAAVADRPDWRWEFTLFDDDKQVNAFALPGGRVGVYSGMLPVAKDEAGLAVVIGHEVAHAIANHGAERASQGTLLGILGQGLAAAAGGSMDPATLQLLMGAYGLGAQVGVLLPFGRAQESEADEIGLILMAKAGYDPRAALDFWERMSKVERQQAAPPEFLSTHPAYGTRVERIRAALPRALAHYDEDTAARARRLPSPAALARPEAREAELLGAVQRLDRLAGTASARAVIGAVAAELAVRPQDVSELATRARLSPGEAALALAIERESAMPLGRLVSDLRRGRGWYEIVRESGASPQVLATRLDRIAARVSGAAPRR